LPERSDPFTEISAIADHAVAFAASAEAVADAVRAIFRAQALVESGGADNLRALLKAMGPASFEGILASLGSRDLVRLYTQVDPNRESVRPTDAAELVTHLVGIAEGTVEPAPRVVLSELDVEGLRAARRSLGADGFSAILKVSKEAVAEALDRLDPHRLGGPHAGARAIAHLTALAEGQDPIPAVDLETLDAAGLVAAREALGETFQAWVAAHAKALRDAVQRIDPHRPGVADLRGPALSAHVTALAEGASPMPDLSVEGLDAEGLRGAYAELGADFAVWLGARKPGELKELLVRVDPHRPNVRGLTAKEYPILLMHIAGGGRTASAEGTGVTPGETRSGRPRRDEGGQPGEA
jgi:hypothetical protein